MSATPERLAQPTAPKLEFFDAAADYAELSEEILACTHEVLASGQVLQGPAVTRLEARIAELAGREHAVAVGSGTDALFFALLGAGVGPGDEVLVPAVTFLASATAILRTGARPVFVDIDAAMDMDLSAAARLISPSTRAVVCVHLFGGVNDPARTETFAADHGLTLIEDFAQSLGATFAGRPAGSLGLAGATSFDPTKVIGSPGSGGALVTDDDALARHARRLRLHGKEGPQFKELGYNSQLPTLAAAILEVKLGRHETWTARRAAVAARYRERLAGLVRTPPVHAEVGHVWHKYVVLCDDRDALAAALRSEGIPTRVHYAQPLHREPLFASTQPDADVPAALAYCAQTLSLPIHSHMTPADADRVADAICRHLP